MQNLQQIFATSNDKILKTKLFFPRIKLKDILIKNHLLVLPNRHHQRKRTENGN